MARYRYLTTSQIIALGIAKHRSNIYRITQRFDAFTKPLVEKSKFSEAVAGRGGRQAKEDLMTLTQRGAEFLIATHPDSNEDIRFVRSKGVSARDYEHTKETVDFHILVDQFAALYGCTVNCFHTYHDHTGANSGRRAAQGIDLLRRQTTFTASEVDEYGRTTGTEHRFSADAVFHLTDPSGKDHLFVVEIQRGMDTKRLYEKLRHHYLPALETGVISDAYGFEKNAKVLIICENPSLVTKTLARLADDPEFEYFHTCFAFHTIAELQGRDGNAAGSVREPRTAKDWNLTRDTRQQIAYALRDRPNWLQIMNDDQRYSGHPKRLATGWRFIDGKTGGIF